MSLATNVRQIDLKRCRILRRLRGAAAAEAREEHRYEDPLADSGCGRRRSHVRIAGRLAARRRLRRGHRRLRPRGGGEGAAARLRHLLRRPEDARRHGWHRDHDADPPPAPGGLHHHHHRLRHGGYGHHRHEGRRAGVHRQAVQSGGNLAAGQPHHQGEEPAAREHHPAQETDAGSIACTTSSARIRACRRSWRWPARSPACAAPC